MGDAELEIGHTAGVAPGATNLAPGGALRQADDDAPDDAPGRIGRLVDDDAPGRIGRLADDLLPALIARLDASGLGEIEVRTDAWRIRLRRPYDRRRTVALPEGRRRRPETPSPADQATADGSPSSPAGHPAPATEGRPLLGGADVIGAATVADPLAPTVATSPAVGYFTPREGWTTGRRVRSGDVLGFVDCLGVRQEVLAPVDGFVGRLLAQAGEAVEYGQPLVHVDPPEAT